MSESTDRIIVPHRFKRHEWLYAESKEDIIELMREYKSDFGVLVWTEETIKHFLNLYHHLYPRAYPEWHHIRCIYTILATEEI